MVTFRNTIRKIGINPAIAVPARVLKPLFIQALASQSPIRVRGTLNGTNFRQTIVKFGGTWLLYVNTEMRRNAGVKPGTRVTIGIEFDPHRRIVRMLPALRRALEGNARARRQFAELTPSRRKEILRYLHSLRSAESVDRNVRRVLLRLSAVRQRRRGTAV